MLDFKSSFSGLAAFIIARPSKAVARDEAKEREEKIQKTEERLIKKEELLDKRQNDIENEVAHLKEKATEIKEIKERTENLEKEKKTELERISGLTKEEAKDEMIKIIEKDSDADILVRLQKIESSGIEKIERRAKEILVSAIHRFGNSVASDTMATAVAIPSDEIKGKIIGKEGRNIKTFERATGVELIVDDTPGVITISCFDPVRRQIARVALENLIIDGRIQPVKIEELVEKARNEINKIIKEKGEPRLS